MADVALRVPARSLARITERPVAAGVAGAMAIAFSGILVRLADVSPSTAAFFRGLYALPVLGALAYLERRRHGARSLRSRRLALLAGIFFAADLVLWHHAIAAVGAGLATVLGNLQVVIVGFAAWALLSERPHRSLFVAIPVVLSGVVLISGVVGGNAYGADPALGVLFGAATSLAYAAFILVLRQGAKDLRRPAGPLFDATAVSVAATALIGMTVGDIHFVPSWPAHGWLITLALAAQVLGWLLISVSLPRLPAALTSMLLLLQPVGALTLGALLLDEDPSVAQLLGVALILTGVVTATARRPKLEPALEPLEQ